SLLTFFFFQAEDGIRDFHVTGVQTCALPISGPSPKPLPAVRKGIVIAGDGAGDAARRVAEAHGWPLLAEPTSGARSGLNAIGARSEERRGGKEGRTRWVQAR